MNKIEEQALKLKEIAKSMLNDKSSKQDTDAVASICDGLDNVIKENGNTMKEYDDLKNDYIGLIKKSGTKEIAKDTSIEDKDPINSDEDFANALNEFGKTIKK